MDALSQRDAPQPGSDWRLQRADPRLLPPGLRRPASSGSWRRAARALWKRKLLALGGVVVALAPVLAWMLWIPAGYRAAHAIELAQPLGSAERAELISVALGPALRQRVAEACGLPPAAIRLTAAMTDLRTITMSASHRDRALAVRALEASTESLRDAALWSPQPPSPMAVQPLRLSPMRAATMLAAVLLGLAGAAAAASRQQLRSRPVGDAEDLAQLTGLPLLILSEGASPHVS
jgi:hypothetical protein